MGNGTFNYVTAIDIQVDSAWGNLKNLTSIDGGDNTVNYITWQSEDYVASGIEVINALRLGIKSGVILGTIYSEFDIVDFSLNINDYFRVEWTIKAT